MTIQNTVVPPVHKKENKLKRRTRQDRLKSKHKKCAHIIKSSFCHLNVLHLYYVSQSTAKDHNYY